MLDTPHNLYLGFAVALAPKAFAYAFIGCVVGTLVGMLPGLGPLAGISLLLPITFGLTPTTAIVLLAGIYYGAMYGGSTTSILMRIPGEAASVMTCIDGYEMTRKGRAGAALAIAAIGSFVAGTLSVVGLMLLAPPLAALALRFGPPEYTALLCLGLIVLAYLSGGSMLKTLAMAVLGLLLGMIGIDTMTGYTRFTYGVMDLGDGLGVVPVAVGLFGLSEIMLTTSRTAPAQIAKPRLRELMPSREEFRASVGPIGRGTVLGFFIGIVPGSAHILSSFVSYALERSLSKHPERFGKVVLLILNLPLVSLFVNLLRVPYTYLYSIILVFCVLGVYAVNQSLVDVWIMIGTGVLGYVLRKLGFEVAPIVLGLIIAPMLELNLRQSLALSAGSYLIFFERPIAAGMLGFAALVLLLSFRSLFRKEDWRRRYGLGTAEET